MYMGHLVCIARYSRDAVGYIGWHPADRSAEGPIPPDISRHSVLWKAFLEGDQHAIFSKVRSDLGKGQMIAGRLHKIDDELKQAVDLIRGHRLHRDHKI